MDEFSTAEQNRNDGFPVQWSVDRGDENGSIFIKYVSGQGILQS